MSAAASADGVASLAFVFDTNVVVDWLIFDHPYLQAMRDAVGARRVEIVTNDLARAELQRVLSYPILKLTDGRKADVLARYDALTKKVAMPVDFGRDKLLLPASFPRCRDSDDDAFLALAYHARAALVTRDRALLKLRKKVRRFEMAILDVQQMVAAIASAEVERA